MIGVAVTDWPAYLLNDVPPHQRALLSAMAEHEDVSVSDVVRGILCAHYGLECEPVSFKYDGDRDRQGERLLLRLQPELWRKLKKDTKGRYGAFRALIQQILDDTLEA